MYDESTKDYIERMNQNREAIKIINAELSKEMRYIEEQMSVIRLIRSAENIANKIRS